MAETLLEELQRKRQGAMEALLKTSESLAILEDQRQILDRRVNDLNIAIEHLSKFGQGIHRLDGSAHGLIE